MLAGGERKGRGTSIHPSTSPAPARADSAERDRRTHARAYTPRPPVSLSGASTTPFVRPEKESIHELTPPPFHPSTPVRQRERLTEGGPAKLLAEALHLEGAARATDVVAVCVFFWRRGVGRSMGVGLCLGERGEVGCFGLDGVLVCW